MTFNEELRPGVLSGEITLSVRLWKSPRVAVGHRYPVDGGAIEVDEITLVPFGSITKSQLARSGETDFEAMRRRAAHAGPIEDATLVYVVTFHAV